MPFCPKCHCEYKKGIKICADCHVELVPTLPEATEVDEQDEEMTTRDWVAVARLTSQQSAEMIVEVLRAKNIPVVLLSGAGHFGITGQMGPSSFRSVGGGYSIMIQKDHIIEADREAGLILGEEWEKAKLVDVED